MKVTTAPFLETLTFTPNLISILEILIFSGLIICFKNEEIIIKYYYSLTVAKRNDL
jgi:hypothetical protein